MLPLIASDGPPADAETVDAVTVRTRAVFACLNAGDYMALLSQLSDDYLRRSFVDGTPTDPIAQDLERFVGLVRSCEACENTPLEGEDLFAIEEIANVRMLDDGRIGADLTVTTPSGARPDWLVVAFVPSEDRLVVDQIVQVDSQGTPVAQLG
jgi:hypothetical protein